MKSCTINVSNGFLKLYTASKEIISQMFCNFTYFCNVEKLLKFQLGIFL